MAIKHLSKKIIKEYSDNLEYSNGSCGLFAGAIVLVAEYNKHHVELCTKYFVDHESPWHTFVYDVNGKIYFDHHFSSKYVEDFYDAQAHRFVDEYEDWDVWAYNCRLYDHQFNIDELFGLVVEIATKLNVAVPSITFVNERVVEYFDEYGELI